MTFISSLRQLKARSVHITTYPTPRSLMETRAVLAALQRFGEVVTFRNLKYDPTNSAPKKEKPTIAIFDSDDAAQAAISASPLQVPIKRHSPSVLFADPHPDHSYSRNHPNSPPKPDSRTEDPQHSPPDPRDFTLNIFMRPARHNHIMASRRNPFHASFSKPDPRTAIHKDLMKMGIEPGLRALADVPAAKKEFLPLAQRDSMAEWGERVGAGSLMGLLARGAGGKDAAVAVQGEERTENKGGEKEDLKKDG
ncbi:hypothetical protein ASPCAL07084 [Aspergillus calidoustus]|uniref:Uncharacterized protein n=1 Tax=Aspergillus calidoustus TaxID=454130 RepID=A0A0U5GXS7_ASPCI|nr:hypothetical protein ASPCAL07084 [Aspergillus calidoustus]